MTEVQKPEIEGNADDSDQQEVTFAKPPIDATFDVHNGYVPHNFEYEGVFDLLHDFVEAYKYNMEALAVLSDVIAAGVQITGSTCQLDGKVMHEWTVGRRERKQYFETKLVTKSE